MNKETHTVYREIHVNTETGEWCAHLIPYEGNGEPVKTLTGQVEPDTASVVPVDRLINTRQRAADEAHAAIAEVADNYLKDEEVAS